MKYVVANWKMNLNLQQIVAWLDTFFKLTPTVAQNKTVVLAPSAPYLGLLAELTKDIPFKLAAQNVSALEVGAHTGEIGVFQIKDFCSFAIVGHSELKEPFELTLKKRDLCLEAGVTPIVCFVPSENAAVAHKKGTILTWEDPGNISVNGNYRAKPADELEKGVNQIRKDLPKDAVLIYGGSVNRQNIQNLAKIGGLDGVLVGNASLDPKHFSEIVADS